MFGHFNLCFSSCHAEILAFNSCNVDAGHMTSHLVAFLTKSRYMVTESLKIEEQ